MLYTNIPKYESLDKASKAVFHEDKGRFEVMSRKRKANESSDRQVDKFKKNLGKTFTGTGDAMDAYYWLTDTRDTLMTMGCPT